MHYRDSCTEARPGSPSPRCPGVCRLDSSFHTAGIGKQGGDTAAWIKANTDPVSASTQKPELCISTDAKVNLGFGTILTLEMSMRVHGKSMSE